MSTSRTYHHGDLRAALLDTTRSVLAQVGIEGLSLREVSRQAGVSHAAAYNHFRDKAGLVRAVVDAAFARLAATMQDARASTSDPLLALERIGIAYVEFAYTNASDFKIMFRPELCGIADPAAARDDDEAYRILIATITDSQSAGAITGGAPEPLVLAAWSMVHGLASLIVDGPNRELAPNIHVARALAGSCIAPLIRGMRASTPAGNNR